MGTALGHGRFFHDIQQERQETEHPKGQVGSRRQASAAGDGYAVPLDRKARQQDPGVVLGVHRPPRAAIGKYGRQRQHHTSEPLIPPVQLVDGEGRAPGESIAAAFHGIRRLYDVLQCPGHQDGQEVHPVTGLLHELPIAHVHPHAFLPVADDPHLGGDVGDGPQRHGQEQGQGRDQPAEDVDEFIGGHHLVVAGEPADHDEHHAPQHDPVDHRLQGDPVAAALDVDQPRHPIMVEQGIDEGHHQHPRQGEQEVDHQGPPRPVEPYGIAERPQERDT